MGEKNAVGAHPSVSAIIIFHNEERFLLEAVDSIMQQSFADWELLLVDDGSDDRSTEIAKAIASRWPQKIRYFEHEQHKNRGMSASRNLGVRHAAGEFVAFLDADDVWTRDKLSRQTSVLEQHPSAAMCYGPVRIWSSWNDSDARETDWYTSYGFPPDRLIEPPAALVAMLEDEFTVPSICSTLVRASVGREVGWFEDDFKGQMEDMVFWTKLFLERPVYLMSECLASYRQHEGNSSKAAMTQGEWIPHKPNPARRRYLEWLAGYLIGSAADASVRLALEKELLWYRS